MSMRKFGIFMLILCTALLCCGSVFAATYYCDSVNGDNNGDGSAEHPWINFDGFVNGVVLQPGDTVIFKDGVYEGAPGNGHGFTLRPSCEGVTFKAENKGGATIVHTSFCENNPGILNFDLNIEGVSCVIDGFNFSDASAGIRITGRKMVEVKNCYFTDLVHNNEVHPRATAIYIEGGGLVDFHNNEVAYLSAGDDMACVAMDNYDWFGEYDTASTSKYYNNLFHDFYNEAAGDIGGTAFWVRGQKGGVQIFNNTFVNIKTGISSENNTRTLATNNIFYGCTSVALSGNCVSSHNLFYGCGTNYNGCSGGPGDVNADPLFVDSMSDFNLAYGSPAVNAGVDMGLPFIGNAPDLGCFESEYTDSEFGTLTGTVTDGNGTPISGMKVFVSAESFGYTGADGTYSFPLDPGSYTVDVIGAGYDRSSNTVDVTVRKGETCTANFTMTKAVHTFYVSPYGDNTNPGTQDEPWATPDAGDKQMLLAPGDTVIVMEGEYLQENYLGFTFANCSGTVDEPITYVAEDGAVINGEYFIYSTYPGLSRMPACLAVAVSNVVFRNFEVANFNVAVLIYGTKNSGVVIDGFDIHGGNPWTGLAPACCGVYFDTSKNSAEVMNCRIHDFQDWAAFMDMTSYNTGDAADHGVFKFHHNYVYNISGHGSWIRGFVEDYIYNNTFYNVTGNVIHTEDLTGSANPNVVNNIFANCGTALAGNGNSTVTNSNNLIFSTNPVAGNVALGADTLTSDPMFTDAANGDFSISDLSPAVNAGVDVGLPFKGPRPDMGAYETDVTVSKTGKISGTVTGTYNGNSYPVGGITITAGEFTATTANDGSFLMAVPVGSYTVSATDSARFTCNSGSVNVTVTPDSVETANFTGEMFMATYYVATDGDDSNDGSEANPWATITNGDHKKVLQPGDTVIVKEGEYYVNGAMNQYDVRLIECDGTAEFPITYKAQGEVKFINDGSQNQAHTNLTTCLHVSADYLIIDGFDFQGGSAPLSVNHKGAGLVVKNCKMHDSDYLTSIWPQSAGIYQEEDTCDLTLENCEIYNIGLDAPGECYGIYNMGNYWSAVPGVQSEYHNNYIHNVKGGALCVRGGQTNDLFVNNTVVDCTAYGVTTAGGDRLPGTVTAVNNIFVNCGTALRAESAACTVTNNNNLIYNCGNVAANTELGAGTIQADPDFTEEPVISDVSPAVNNGVDVGLPFKGVAPDMGCYETDVQDYLTGNVIVTVTTSDLDAPA
ncbi:MAG: right-handed parallel beta-helix repeat-containing protein, partial [Abditibacteriota bacterium]|nr:right-handed parallel beta-helix repeat-containing protein [Abditibacteriota bacterium]